MVRAEGRSIRPLLLGGAAAVLLVASSQAGAVDSGVLRAEHHLRKGLQALQRDQLDRAEGAFLRARSAAPELPQPEVLLGHVEMARGHFDEAEGAYLAAIERFRQLAGRMRIASERRAQQIRDRIDRISIQISTADTGTPSLARPGAGARKLRLEARARSLRRAAEELRTSAVDGGVPAECFYFLGGAQLRGGRPAQAVQSYRAAAELAPAEPDVRYRLALALALSGRRIEAAEQCDEAERLGHPAAAELRARIQAPTGGPEEPSPVGGKVVLIP